MSSIQSKICFLTPKKLQPDYPLFVFLPGMDGTGQLLRTQTVGLEAGFDVRCLAIPPDDLTDWDGLTTQVLQLMQAELSQKPNQRVYLCGESFGGCLALKLMLKAPELVERLILVNPASSFRRRPWIEWGSYLTRWFSPSVYHAASVALMPFLATFTRMLPRDRQELLRVIQMVPQKTSIWRLTLLQEFQMSPADLSQIAQPVLVLASAGDRLLPSVTEGQYLTHYLPQSQLVVLPESGHTCLLEADVNLYDIMRASNFLQHQRDLVARLT